MPHAYFRFFAPLQILHFSIWYGLRTSVGRVKDLDKAQIFNQDFFNLNLAHHKTGNLEKPDLTQDSANSSSATPVFARQKVRHCKQDKQF